MNRTPRLLLAFALAAGGCRTIGFRGAVTPEIEKEIRRSQPRSPLRVAVRGADGREVPGEILRVLPGEVRVSVRGSEARLAPTAIDSIEVKDRGTGAVMGLGIGLLVGALAGAAFARSTADRPDSRGLATIWGVLFGGALGGCAGALVGNGIGDVTTYRFEPHPDDR